MDKERISVFSISCEVMKSLKERRLTLTGEKAYGVVVQGRNETCVYVRKVGAQFSKNDPVKLSLESEMLGIVEGRIDRQATRLSVIKLDVAKYCVHVFASTDVNELEKLSVEIKKVTENCGITDPDAGFSAQRGADACHLA
ncbi:MAG: hypothetical protein LBC95_03235 [Candidatus Nomurabacteria bacterium]|jgi:hypothetical protein|nr:hypothetical protein [Candidatus Nomurabacteria bacterium]